MKLILLINLLFSSYVFALQNNGPEYYCTPEADTYCHYKDVVTTVEEPYFKPLASNMDITKIMFDSSSLPIFTNDICENFKKLEDLVIRSTNIEQIMENAFHNCKNLKKLDLYANKLTSLHATTFKYNANLEVLRMDVNQLDSFPADLFIALVNLTALHLSDNQISKFPSYLLQQNEKLESLIIHSNELVDLDYDKLIKNLKNLQNIEYNANQFSCVHVQDMNAAFTANGITVGTTAVNRKRYYDQIQVGNILCSPDVSWSSAYYRIANNKIDDADDFLYTRKQVKDMINAVIEESNFELKEELKNMKMLIQYIYNKIQKQT